MADYYPLIARAVSGLEKSTGESRRALYERARTALLTELQGVEPALSEADITRERLALEEAIRRVEAEAARRPHVEAPPQPETPAAQDQEASGAPAAAPSAERDESAFMPEWLGAPPARGEASARAGKSPHEPFESLAPPSAEADRIESGFEVEDLLRSPRELLPAKPSEAPPRMGRPRRGAEAGRPPQPEDFEPPAKERPSLRSGLGRTARSLIIAAIVAAVAIGGFFAYREWPNIAGLVPQGSTTQVTQKTPPTSSKITDRIGAQSQPDTSAAPQSPTPTTQVAQRVVLYEQQPNSQQRKQYLGSVTWRTEMMSPGPGLPPDLAIKADVEIPERQMRVSLTLQRNTDKTLPASHTIEILFSTPPDFPPGGVTDVPGVLMEEAQTSNGAPLAGMRVKVSEGYFLIGLSPLESEARRNVLLLKQRPWLQIPIIYKNNQRALLAIEKGVPGDRVFADAFAAWKQ